MRNFGFEIVVDLLVMCKKVGFGIRRIFLFVISFISDAQFIFILNLVIY